MPKGEKKAGGRPKVTKKWSDNLKKSVARALTKYAKSQGKDFAEVLVEMFYDTKVMDTARIGVAKVICEILVVKESERTIEERRIGPSIGLPPMKARPPAPAQIGVLDEAETEKRVH